MNNLSYKVLNTLQLVIRYAQGISGLQKDDIILSSYAKSGNTWIRFFLCNIISECEWGGRTVDFHTLDTTMPELGVSNLRERWQHSAIPRFVKTHKRYWPIFHRHRSILVIRDPRDVMVSLYHARKGYRNSPYEGTFSQFLRHPQYGLKAWCDHYNSWKRHCTVVVEYEELRKDDVRRFDEMLRALKIAIPIEIVGKAARKARFDEVKTIERKYGLSRPELYQPEFRFAREGKSGGWSEYFTTDDVAYFESFREGWPAGLKF